MEYGADRKLVSCSEICDCLQCSSASMKSNSDPAAKRGPHSTIRRPSGGLPTSEVFGFPVVNNQFNVLQSNQIAGSPSQEQREEGLVDPKSTRFVRQAAQRTEDQGIVADGGVPATVTVLRNA